MRQRALVFACAAAVTGCLVPPPPPLAGGLYPVALDSLGLAYEMGRRDAARRHWIRSPIAATTVAVPLALAVARDGGDLSLLPLAMVGSSAIAVGWSWREYNKPLPEPGDSLRAWHRLTDTEMWRRYRAGYQDAIGEQRRATFTQTANVAATSTLTSILLWYALRRRY